MDIPQTLQELILWQIFFQKIITKWSFEIIRGRKTNKKFSAFN